MPVADGSVLKAVAEFVLDDGTILQNIFHFIAQFLTTQTSADVIGAVKSYVEDIYADVDGYVPSTTGVNPFTLHRVAWNATEGLWEVVELIGSDTPSITFTGATEQWPSQVSAVMVGNTTRPKSRGRKFFVPFLETAASASDLVAAVITALGTALNHYLADQAIDVDNTLSPGVPRSAADTFLEFSNGAVNSVVGTQRRRKPGIGA